MNWYDEGDINRGKVGGGGGAGGWAGLGCDVGQGMERSGRGGSR